MRTSLRRRSLALLVLTVIAGCAANKGDTSPATDKFSFALYSTNEKPIRLLDTQLKKLDSRQQIEDSLMTQGGARKESFDDQIIFYVYESPAPVLAWAIITKVTYDQNGKPRGISAMRDSVPRLVSPAENPQQFHIKPWVTYGNGYGKARLNSLLKETFAIGTACAKVSSVLQASGDMDKTRQRTAKDTGHTYVSVYKTTTLPLIAWEHGVSFNCDNDGNLQTAPVSFGRYTGI